MFYDTDVICEANSYSHGDQAYNTVLMGGGGYPISMPNFYYITNYLMNRNISHLGVSFLNDILTRYQIETVSEKILREFQLQNVKLEVVVAQSLGTRVVSRLLTYYNPKKILFISPILSDPAVLDAVLDSRVRLYISSGEWENYSLHIPAISSIQKSRVHVFADSDHTLDSTIDPANLVNLSILITSILEEIGLDA